jgi:hypothetical protein
VPGSDRSGCYPRSPKANPSLHAFKASARAVIHPWRCFSTLMRPSHPVRQSTMVATLQPNCLCALEAESVVIITQMNLQKEKARASQHYSWPSFGARRQLRLNQRKRACQLQINHHLNAPVDLKEQRSAPS